MYTDPRYISTQEEGTSQTRWSNPEWVVCYEYNRLTKPAEIKTRSEHRVEPLPKTLTLRVPLHTEGKQGTGPPRTISREVSPAELATPVRRETNPPNCCKSRSYSRSGMSSDVKSKPAKFNTHFPKYEVANQFRTWEGYWYPDQFLFLKQLRSYCLNRLSNKKTTDPRPLQRILLSPARQILSLYGGYRTQEARCTGRIFNKMFVEKFSPNVKELTVCLEQGTRFVPQGTFLEACSAVWAVEAWPWAGDERFVSSRFIAFVGNWDFTMEFWNNVGQSWVDNAVLTSVAQLTDRASIATNIVRAMHNIHLALRQGQTWSELLLSLNDFYRSFDFKNQWANGVLDSIKSVFPDFLSTNPLDFLRYITSDCSTAFLAAIPLLGVAGAVQYSYGATEVDAAKKVASTFVPQGKMDDIIQIATSDVSILMSKLVAFTSSVFVLFSLKPGEKSPELSLEGLMNFGRKRVSPLLLGTIATGGLALFFEELGVVLNLVHNCVSSLFKGDFSRFCGINSYEQIHQLFSFLQLNYGTVAPNGPAVVFSDREDCESPVTLRLPCAVFNSSDEVFVEMIDTLEGLKSGDGALDWATGNRYLTKALNTHLNVLYKRTTHTKKARAGLEKMMAALVLMNRNVALEQTQRKAEGLSFIVTGNSGIGKSTYVNNTLHPMMMNTMFDQGFAFKYPRILSSGVTPGDAIPSSFTCRDTLDANFTNRKTHHQPILALVKDDPHPGNPDAIGTCKLNIASHVMEIAETTASLMDAAALTSLSGNGVKDDNYNHVLGAIFTDNRALANMDHFSNYLPACVRRCKFIEMRTKKQFATESGALNKDLPEVAALLNAESSADVLMEADVNTFVRLTTSLGSPFAYGEHMTKETVSHTFHADQSYGVGRDRVEVRAGSHVSMKSVSINRLNCYVLDILQHHYKTAFTAFNAREVRAFLTPSQMPCTCAGSSAILHCVNCAGFSEFCPSTGYLCTLCHHCRAGTESPTAFGAIENKSLLQRIRKITHHDHAMFRFLMFSPSMRPIMKSIIRKLDPTDIFQAHAEGRRWTIAEHGGPFVEGGGLKKVLSDACKVQKRKMASVDAWWAIQFPKARNLKETLTLFFTYVLYTPFQAEVEQYEAGAEPLKLVADQAIYCAGVNCEPNVRLRIANKRAPSEHCPENEDIQQATAISLMKLWLVFVLLETPGSSSILLGKDMPGSGTFKSLGQALNVTTGLDLKQVSPNSTCRGDILSSLGTCVGDYLGDFLEHLTRSIHGKYAFPDHKPLVTYQKVSRNSVPGLAQSLRDAVCELEPHGVVFEPQMDSQPVYGPPTKSFSEFECGLEEEKDDDTSSTEFDHSDIISDVTSVSTVPEPVFGAPCYIVPGLSPDLLEASSENAFAICNDYFYESCAAWTRAWTCSACTGFERQDPTGGIHRYHHISCSLVAADKSGVPTQRAVVSHFGVWDRPKFPFFNEVTHGGHEGMFACTKVSSISTNSYVVNQMIADVRDSLRRIWYRPFTDRQRNSILFAGGFAVGYVGTRFLLGLLGQDPSDKPTCMPEFVPQGDVEPTTHGVSKPWWQLTDDDPIRSATALHQRSAVANICHGQTVTNVVDALFGNHKSTPVSRVCKLSIDFAGGKGKMHGLLLDEKSLVCPAHLFSSSHGADKMSLEISVYRVDTKAWVTHNAVITPADVCFGENGIDVARVAHGLASAPFKEYHCFYKQPICGRAVLQAVSTVSRAAFNVPDTEDHEMSNHDPGCMLTGLMAAKYDATGVAFHQRDKRMSGAFSHPGTPGADGDCGMPIIFHSAGKHPTIGMFTGTMFTGKQTHRVYHVITQHFMEHSRQILFGSVSGTTGPTPSVGIGPFHSRFVQQRHEEFSSFEPQMNVVVDHGVPSTKEDFALIEHALVGSNQTIRYASKVRKMIQWQKFMPGHDGDCANNGDAPIRVFARSKDGVGKSCCLPVFDSRPVKGIYPDMPDVKPVHPAIASPGTRKFVPELFHLGCMPWVGRLHRHFEGLILGMVGPGKPSPDGNSLESNSLDAEIAKTMVNAEIPRWIVRKAGTMFLASKRRVVNSLLPRVDKDDMMQCLRNTVEDSYMGIYREDGSTVFGGYDLTTSCGANYKPMSGSKKSDLVMRTEEGLMILPGAVNAWNAMLDATYCFTMGVIPPHQYLSVFIKDECYPVTCPDATFMPGSVGDGPKEFFSAMYGISHDDPFFDIEPGDAPAYRSFFHALPQAEVKVKSRAVFNLPGAVNLAFRMLMMPLLYLFATFPIHFDFVAGLDMAGPQFEQSTWEVLLAAWDPQARIFRCFDADVNAWDKIMPSTLTYETLLVMSQLVIDLHLNFGTYNPQISHYTGALLNWWSGFEVFYRGVLFVAGIMPSGLVITLAMNSTMNGLLITCVLIQFCEDSGIPLPESFDSWIIHKAHGDDSQTAVKAPFVLACRKAGVEPFSSRDFTRILGRWGILATLGNKSTGAQILYQEIGDLVFLQHTLKYQIIPAWSYADCRAVPARFGETALIGASPMKCHTLIKMLAVQDMESVVSKPYLLLSQVRSLVYELLPYGREKVRRFQRTMDSFHCDLWKPVGDSALAIEYAKIFDWNVTLSWYVDKFCRDGTICPSILKARNKDPDVFKAVTAKIGFEDEEALVYEHL